MTTELDETEGRRLAQTVRERLAERRISRQRLADEAGISLSTLEKALGGGRAFTLATVVRLEQVLGPLRPRAPVVEAAASAAAPVELGGYTRAAVQWLEGDYLTLRPSFERPEAIYAYRTEIYWQAEGSRLAFREAARLDGAFSQAGRVSAPLASGHVYLHTNESGQMRTAILSRPLRTGEMYGLLATLVVGSGSQLIPAASPLALIPLTPQARFGRIEAGDPDYETCRRHLDRVAKQGFARFFGP